MTLNTPIAIIVASILAAGALICASPRYQLYVIPNATNPAVWRIDLKSGEVKLCATAANKDSESGCSANFKQF